MINIADLLQLYLDDRLPEDVTLVHVPVTKTAYGDYRIADRYWGPDRRRPVLPDDQYAGLKEDIRLEEHKIRNQTIFAGYGKDTRTLVVGKEEQ